MAQLAASNAQNQPVDIQVFITEVVEASLASYKQLGESLIADSFVLSNFDTIKADLTKKIKGTFKWKQEFETMLKFSGCEMALVSDRIRQLEVYEKFKQIKEISTLLLKLKELNNLTGNFKALTQIHSSLHSEDYHQKRISDIDVETVRIYEELEVLGEDNMKVCLNKFIDNFEFIKWLKSIAHTLQKLKILAEIASESENEGALEIVRCQSLTMVCTAYGPLIYDLPPSADYTTLLKLTKQVQHNLSKNPNLPHRIDVIAKERQWIDDVKNSKGNTEASTLKQAGKINERGIYEVALKPRDPKSNAGNPCLNDVIRLSVERDPSNPNDKVKTYTYLELVDLHDKLALVVGKEKGEQEIIRYFEDIFEGVVSIAQIYLSLLKSGTVLFNRWLAQVYCSEANSMDNPNTIKINFGADLHCKNIFGDRRAKIRR